jgi:hypothetical protein
MLLVVYFSKQLKFLVEQMRSQLLLLLWNFNSCMFNPNVFLMTKSSRTWNLLTLESSIDKPGWDSTEEKIASICIINSYKEWMKHWFARKVSWQYTNPLQSVISWEMHHVHQYMAYIAFSIKKLGTLPIRLYSQFSSCLASNDLN